MKKEPGWSLQVSRTTLESRLGATLLTSETAAPPPELKRGFVESPRPLMLRVYTMTL